MNKTSFLFLRHCKFDIKNFIRNTLKEDIGKGDHTSLATISPSAKSKAVLMIKEDGILAGVELAKMIFAAINKQLKIRTLKQDGQKVRKGDIAFIVQGNARSILAAERTVLNCMQRMSGIATATHLLAEKCKPYKVKVIDTRKTFPGLRALEKWAVRIGGGYNHRFGLYDMVLIKNNHIALVGGIHPAIESATHYLQKKNQKLKIEIETRNLSEVREILSIGKIDRIMLDNFSVPQTKQAVQLINGKYEIEISGGINEKNIHKYASLGADYISVGALTHSVKSLDMSLTVVV